jgi:hypothetical protein
VLLSLNHSGIPDPNSAGPHATLVTKYGIRKIKTKKRKIYIYIILLSTKQYYNLI